MNRMSRVSLGLVWQLNRNVAFKAVLYPTTSSDLNESSHTLSQPSSYSNNNQHGITQMTTAILLKRWSYPRITCSILHQWRFHNNSVTNHNRIFPTVQFAGIGIDIETGDNDDCRNNNRREYHSSTATGTNENDDEEDNIESPKLYPPTIAVLPKELYKLKQRQP